ncbi:MAG TPA: GNAT family N-acetyltransferase [bacterium]
MEKSINIRSFDVNHDFEQVQQLDSCINGNRQRDVVYQDIKNYSGQIYIADIDGIIVGFVSLSRSFWNDIAMIDHLAVIENWRKKGVGRLLINHILNEGRKRNIRFICVQTALWNFGAIEFYKRLAFSLRGIFPEYIGEGNDMVWLDIDLRKRL